MNKQKKGLLIFIVLLAAVAAVYFFGIGGASASRYVQYQHPELGFVLPVPESWSLAKETQNAAAWQSEEDDFALLVMGQLGGYSYYDMAGMGNIMADLLQESISQWEEVSREVRKDLPKCYRIKGQGVDRDGNPVVTDGLILEPMQAVCFYVIGMGGPEQYQEYQDLLEDVYNGFDVVLSADEIYGLMMEWKEDEAAETESLPEALDNSGASDG